MSLYDRVLARSGGARALAVARLKRTVLAALHEAFGLSAVGSQSDLARRLQVRRSAVNQVFNGDGNVRISTLAEYLYEMGYELDVSLVRSGEPRTAALEGREVRTTACNTSSSGSAYVALRASQTGPMQASEWLRDTSMERVHSGSLSPHILMEASGMRR
jgi:transcriptional regulator with XRE-family HTH domain